MWWVSVLLTAEGPLAVGVAWATGHSGTVLANCSYSSPEMLARPSSETQITCSKTQMKTNVYVKVYFVHDMEDSHCEGEATLLKSPTVTWFKVSEALY